MTPIAKITLMEEIRDCLTRSGADTVDLVDVAGRLLTSAFRSLGECNPGAELEPLVDRTLGLLRSHLLGALDSPGDGGLKN